MSRWYYVHDKQRCGPVATGELRTLLQQGTVQPATLVWNNRIPTWLPLSKALPQMVRNTPRAQSPAPAPAVVPVPIASDVPAASALMASVAPASASGRPTTPSPALLPLMEEEAKKGIGISTVLVLSAFAAVVLGGLSYGIHLHTVYTEAVAAAGPLLQKAQVPPDMMPATVGSRYLARVDSPGPLLTQMQETQAVVRARYVKYLNPFGGEIRVEAMRFATEAEARARCQEYRGRFLHEGTEDTGVYYADQKSPAGVPLPTDGTTCSWVRGDTFYTIIAHYSVRDELRSFAVLYLGSTSAAP